MKLAIALFALALALAACFVDRKSESLACSVPTDCAAGRTCVDGFCVLGQQPVDARQPPDAFVCPSVCSSCDATGQCLVMNPGATPFKCPSGWRCMISCTVAAGCGDIDCSQAQSCDVECTTAGACNALSCGPGACKVACTVDGACNGIDCASSCRCDVSCTPSTSSCGTMSCPMGPGGKFCTSNGTSGQACSSSFHPSCSSC